MAKKISASKKISFEIDPKIHEELSLLAKKVGFENLEALIKNYLREVLISARTEVATAELRNRVFNESTDLDNLKTTLKTKP